MKKLSVVSLCYVAMMSAIGVVLSLVFKIPMGFLAPWLSLDLSFVPMMLTGFSLGPVAGLCVLAVTNLVRLFTSNSGGVGQIADVLMGLCFLLPASFIYQRIHNRRGALIGMAVSTLALIVGGVLANLYILFPLYFGAGYAEGLAKMGFPSVFNCVMVAVVPFNLIKGAAVSLVTFVLYKHLSRLLHAAESRRSRQRA